GKQYDIQVQRYRCKNCGKLSQTEFHDEYGPYSNFSKETKNKTVKIMRLDSISLRNTSKIHKIFSKIKISHESVRSSVSVHNKLYYVNDDVELSGYYGYDEQWAKISGTWKYRYVLFDIINNVPITEILNDTVDEELVKSFIKDNIPPHKRKGIVTDMLNEYDGIMNDLGFDHQYCILHFIRNVSKKITTHL
ncbi:hypothetical protein, partial [Methanobrevibacter cuticularis]|uniref:hypothetical protein n=1 Tax=Methanobrevibacter cuticularis TaxID=47311 RepID=UPI000A7CDE23